MVAITLRLSEYCCIPLIRDLCIRSDGRVFGCSCLLCLGETLYVGSKALTYVDDTGCLPAVSSDGIVLYVVIAVVVVVVIVLFVACIVSRRKRPAIVSHV